MKRRCSFERHIFLDHKWCHSSYQSPAREKVPSRSRCHAYIYSTQTWVLTDRRHGFRPSQIGVLIVREAKVCSIILESSRFGFLIYFSFKSMTSTELYAFWRWYLCIYVVHVVQKREYLQKRAYIRDIEDFTWLSKPPTSTAREQRLTSWPSSESRVTNYMIYRYTHTRQESNHLRHDPLRSLGL